MRSPSINLRLAAFAAILVAAALLSITLPDLALLLGPTLLFFGVLLLGFTPGAVLLDRMRARRMPRRAERAPLTLRARRVVVARRMPSPASSALAMRPPPAR